jgi:hypothetical protein
MKTLFERVLLEASTTGETFVSDDGKYEVFLKESFDEEKLCYKKAWI